MPSEPKTVQLIELAPAAIHALAAGDLVTASQVSAVPLTSYLVQPAALSTWRRRSDQLRADPTVAGWITRLIYDPARRLTVGRAGFHAPPDRDGMVELGYAVDPVHRRQGYARAALLALLDQAVSEPAIRTVRASISPDNLASRQLVGQYGFLEVGEQIDDEDGPETIFEIRLDRPRTA